jgi:hypothetical protein
MCRRHQNQNLVNSPLNVKINGKIRDFGRSVQAPEARLVLCNEVCWGDGLLVTKVGALFGLVWYCLTPVSRARLGPVL